MSTYDEAIMHTQHELEAEAKRDEATRGAVTAALAVLDAAYPEFKRSNGPFGDKLAGTLHRAIEQAFNEVAREEEKELTTLELLKGKYRGVQFYG